VNRDDAIKAVDGAFAQGINHLYDVFVRGLITKQPLAELSEHFRNGFAFQCDAHAKTTAIVNDYFRGLKP